MLSFLEFAGNQISKGSIKDSKGACSGLNMDISMVHFIFSVFFSDIVCKDILEFHNTQKGALNRVDSLGNSSMPKKRYTEHEKPLIIRLPPVLLKLKRLLILQGQNIT